MIQQTGRFAVSLIVRSREAWALAWSAGWSMQYSLARLLSDIHWCLNQTISESPLRTMSQTYVAQLYLDQSPVRYFQAPILYHPTLNSTSTTHDVKVHHLPGGSMSGKPSLLLI
jgi:hypothetical protein